MITHDSKKYSIFKSLVFTILLLAGCSDSGNGNGAAGGVPQATYRITMTNLTANQPFSPFGVVLHDGGYTGWVVGEPITDGLEILVEGGDPADFLAEADLVGDVIGTASGTGVVGPGTSGSVEITVDLSPDLRLTAATMLVNTNDAFTGAADQPIGHLGIDERLVMDIMPYDAGTEQNSETALSIPGPAGDGEGYNAERADTDFVSVHQGVITEDDGYPNSALDESHRFMSPVGQLTVTRID